MQLGERLEIGDVVIMDGGTGTEIQRRGHAMDAEVWSGVAHMADPDAVRRIHEDYIRAGAEIIIANTFSTARSMLDSKGLGDDFETINRRAVELAVEARDGVTEAPVWVAGSISSMTPLSRPGMTAKGAGTEDEFRRQAEVLAQAGSDLIIAEMMLDTDGALAVVRAARSVGLPLWVGFSATLTDTGQVIGYHPNRYGDAVPTEGFGGLVEAVLAEGPDVAGVMHSHITDTGPALEVLAAHWQGPKMAYAETGSFAPPTWVFEEAASPDDYADAAVGWVEDHGVQIVGGCCGTGPNHIAALTDRLA